MSRDLVGPGGRAAPRRGQPGPSRRPDTLAPRRREATTRWCPPSRGRDALMPRPAGQRVVASATCEHGVHRGDAGPVPGEQVAGDGDRVDERVQRERLDREPAEPVSDASMASRSTALTCWTRPERCARERRRPAAGAAPSASTVHGTSTTASAGSPGTRRAVADVEDHRGRLAARDRRHDARAPPPRSRRPATSASSRSSSSPRASRMYVASRSRRARSHSAQRAGRRRRPRA